MLTTKNTLITLALLTGFIYGLFTAVTHTELLYSNIEVFNWVDQWQQPWLINVAKSVTFLGSTTISMIAFVLFFILLAYYRCWKSILVVFVAACITIILLVIFKLMVLSPRPLQEAAAALGSFPSGHTTRASLVFGLLLMLNLKSHSNNIITTILCCLIPILVGISRLVLNEHWLNDVLSSYFLATLILYLCYQIGFKSFEENIPIKQINWVLGCYFILIFLGHFTMYPIS